MKKWILGLCLSLAAGNHALADASPNGRWITGNGLFEVEIASCGRALCGVVLKRLADHSPGAAANSVEDPTIGPGTKLLSEFLPTNDGQWKGKLFDSDGNKTYDCLVHLEGARLAIHPYMGMPLFGKTFYWTRDSNNSAPQT